MFALDGRGGGNALPPFLQGRTPNSLGKFVTKPILTPKSTIVPGEVKPAAAKKTILGPGGMAGQPAPAPKPAITPKTPAQGVAPAPAQANAQSATPGAAATTKPTPQTLYDFFKQDLEDQRKLAEASSVSDAASRGVYYGSPLTTSLGDIHTQYLRGLGSLQAGILQNEQQNELSRLGIASGLLGSAPMPQGGGIDPATLQMLGSLFGQSSVASGARSGPSGVQPTMTRSGGGIKPKVQ